MRPGRIPLDGSGQQSDSRADGCGHIFLIPGGGATASVLTAPDQKPNQSKPDSVPVLRVLWLPQGYYKIHKPADGVVELGEVAMLFLPEGHETGHANANHALSTALTTALNPPADALQPLRNFDRRVGKPLALHHLTYFQ